MLQAVAMLSGPIFALILILAERRIGAPQTDWRINLQSWLLRIVGAFTVYGAVQAWSGPALIDGAELPIWAAVLIYVLVYDLAEYLFHRMQHRIPVLWAANFSFGVAVLAHLVERAATLLPDWDCEIFEAHHRHKRDAPSGTALMLGRAVASARGRDEDAASTDRSGERRPGTTGYAVVRAGDIVGEHAVWFAGASERIELAHRAGDRDLFARGALVAAEWLARRAAGRYTISDVLGIG